ncbi:MAG: replication initiation protein [Burkholderiaceae bacterium]|nr:replication initiation protein [Burkholderiaceae bacterium]MBX9937154.1 replication initiation protein [Burkholderiaceae bacterium]
MFALYEPTQEHQQELFVDAHRRWPKRPYCSDDLESGLRIRSLMQALKKPYIQANPPYLRVWSIYDVDRPYCDYEKGEFHRSAVLAWEDANLPPPSWASVNRENGHAHLVYGLSAPVLIDGMGARDAPIRLLCSIEAMFRALLQADQGFSGLITKNPTHPLWKTLRGPQLFYDLHELAESLPGLEKFRPKARRVEEVGLGRNVTLFDHLRHWAYRNIRNYKGGGLSGWNAWLSLCNTKALVRNGDFPRPMDGKEVWHVARSVAKWTYKHFDIEASDARFSKTQAYRGSLGGKASGVMRRASSEGQRADARIMAAAGMTQLAIAQELGVTDRTVRNWLHGAD